MALVCDIKSDKLKDDDQNEDLEDGEIEDDDDVDVPAAPPPQEKLLCLQPPPPVVQQQQLLLQQQQQQIFRMVEPSGLLKQDLKLPPTSMLPDKHGLDKADKKRHQKKQLTEAEKSVMRLHKIERMEREKREKYRREQAMVLHPIEQEEDYAMVLEKAIAKVLKKDKPSSDGEEKEEETKRGKKRKKKEKHNKKNKKNKQLQQQQQLLQQESPKLEEFDESEMLNMRGGSPDLRDHPSPVPTGLAPPGTKTDEDSYDSETSSSKSGSDGRRERRKHRGKRQFEHGNRTGERKYRERSRERSREREKRAKATKRNNGVCLYYLQGMCEDNNCPYSHETVQPLKLELCKFYLLDCCAKGDKCLYMHSDFPCKFYHTGIPCPHNENCKFAHGGPLSDNLKQILFKHIETAPKEILGNFPRLSRDNASVMIIQAQKQLEGKYGPPKKDRDQQQGENGSSKGGGGDIPSLFDLNFANPSESQGGESSDGSTKKENKRNRPSRWQDPEPLDKSADKGKAPFGIKGGFKDQDMRINSNGDVDMRTLSMQPTIHTTNIVNPNILAQKPPQLLVPPPNLMLPFVQSQLLKQSGAPLQNVLQSAVNLLNPGLLAQSMAEAVDIEKYKMEAAGHKEADLMEASRKDTDIRQLDMGLLRQDTDIRGFNKNQSPTDEDEENNLQIVMDEEEQKDESPTASYLDTLPKTQRDLFKRIQAQQKEATIQDTAHSSDNENDANIDWYSDDEDDNKLTIEETKHEEERDIEPAPVKPLEFEQLGDLSKIDISAEVTKLLTTISKQSQFAESKEKEVKTLGSPRDPRQGDRDPRRRLSSVEEKPVSIYEQGSISDVGKDIDLRAFGDTDLRGRPDVDLRQLGLPFKGMQNYTPATEIDASINSHTPITWKVYIVEIPKPDYTGLKLSATEAQTTGDPRLRKIFRLSTEEKDSPASPKESPKMSAPTVRVDPRRKKLEAELKPSEANMTYTQQLAMLQSSPFYGTLTSNQKVMLNQELARRNDQSGQSDPIIGAMLQNLGLISQAPTGGQSQALNILANVNNIGFPPPVMGQNMGPGLLGPAPPVQNFPMNFDPRNEGLLGNGPPFGFQEGNNFGGFNEDFYPPDGGNFNNGNQGNNNRDNMRGFRDRPRRGRNANNNRNNRNFFRRHNRNRNNSPP